jgi:transcriptional regulator with XRE-family HTH domain
VSAKVDANLRPWLAQIGLRISELRASEGLTQEELAERADLALEQLQRCERGRQNFKFETFLKIAVALEIDPIHLLAKPVLKERPVGRPPKRQTADTPPKKKRRRRSTG